MTTQEQNGDDIDETREKNEQTKVTGTPGLPDCKRAPGETLELLVNVENKRARLGGNYGTEELKASATKEEEESEDEIRVGLTGNSQGGLRSGFGTPLRCKDGGRKVAASLNLEKTQRPVPIESSPREKLEKGAIVSRLIAEVAEDRGSRHTMEDARVLLPQAWIGSPGSLRCAHFAIYDGHGGRHAAEYARAHLHANVLSAGLPRESSDIKGVKRAIIEGFKKTDESLLRESSAGGWQDGATAVCVWVLGQMVFVANVGDAKAVLARVATKVEGEVASDLKAGSDDVHNPPLKGLIVTREHKAIYPQERARIQKAGGYVEANGRLLGRLEVSRAFGDRTFKKAGVIAVPDIHAFELTERERFLILGCDGLWGVFGPSDAVEFMATQLKDGATVGIACKRLVREAVRERKCKDNCTAIVVHFEHLPL